MNEDYLQYVWRYQRLPHGRLKCTSGRNVDVLFQGHWNKQAGPDFLEAKLRMGKELWHGSVEIHIKSSDWRKHRHTGDPAYANVILHVVFEDDEPLVNESGQEVPTLILDGLLDEQHWQQYLSFIGTPERLPCASMLDRVNGPIRSSWLHRMAVERLAERTKRIGKLMTLYRSDWNAVWWNVLCRAFGFGLNQGAYEALAHALPWQITAKIANRPQSVESLLAVHSGWWELDRRLRELGELCHEYKHLKRLHDLKAVHPGVWKRGRMKPGNHPRVRLGQLAAMLVHGAARWSSIANVESLDELRALFDVTIPVNALNMKAEKGTSERLGKTSIDLLIANAAIPVLFYKARANGNQDMVDQTLSWMEELSPESNRVSRMWNAIGWKPENLLDSQGHLHLFNEYCCQKKCLSCSIGVTLLNKP